MTFAAQKVLAGRQPIDVLEIDLDFCQLTYGRLVTIGGKTCAAALTDSGTAQAGGGIDPGVRIAGFGSGQGFERTSDLTSNADTKKITISIRFEVEETVLTRTNQLWTTTSSSGGGANPGILIFRRGSNAGIEANTIKIRMWDPTPGLVYEAYSSTAYTAAGEHHLLFSIDLAAGTSHFYIDDVNEENIITSPVNAFCNVTNDRHWAGRGTTSGSSEWDGVVKELYVNYAEFIDLSTQANRDKFDPNTLGADGSGPTGNSPIVFLDGDANSFGTNKGSGGNFTKLDAPVSVGTDTGSITLAATAPSTDMSAQYVRILSGPGVGQEGLISAYNTTTKKADIDASSSWPIAPDNTSTYSVHDADGVAVADRMCFNTRKTCQDPTNYNPAAKIYRFCEARPNLPTDEDLLPCLRSIKLTNTKLDPGRGLGVRAKAVAVCDDFPYHDIGLDKYLANRSYAAIDRGTYFGKLIARNPYYQSRAMRIRSGFITDPWDWANFETREYVLESIDGPSSNARVTFTGKDVLKFAEDKRAQVPKESRGTLSAAMDASQTTATLDLADVTDAASEYPTTGGTWRITDEIMTYTARSGSSVTGITRAQGGTTAATHDVDEIVQLCQSWTSISVIQIIKELLEDFAGVPTAYIPFTDWQAERDVWMVDHNFTRILSEPTGVNKVLAQLLEVAQLYIYWDELTQTIPLKAVRPPDKASLTTINDADNLMQRTLNAKQQPDKRLTRISIAHHPRNQVDVDKLADYQRIKISIDSEAESSDQYGDVRRKQILAPWLTDANSALAIAVSARLVQRYRDNPKKVTFELDAKDSSLWTADHFYLNTADLPGFDGAAEDMLMQVISVAQKKDSYLYETVTAFGAGRFGFIGPNTLSNYDVESEANKDKYAWVAPDAETFISDGTQAYQII